MIIIRDVSFLGYEWRELADGCLWELVPQSSPSPIYQYFPLSALVEYGEPRLPANWRHSRATQKYPESSHPPAGANPRRNG